MTRKTRETRAGGVEPDTVRLHLHRGIGWGLYGTATVAVFALVLAGTVAALQSGKIITAAVLAVVGLALTAFLAVVTHAMVAPALTVRATGVSGRLPRGKPIDVRWDDVLVDVDDTAGPGALRLSLGDHSVSVSARSWIGFRELVVLLASTPEATARLTPAARREVARLLGVGG